MLRERDIFTEVSPDRRSSVKKECEKILVTVLDDIKTDPEGVCEGLEVIKSGWDAREYENVGEAEKLSPVRASALYLLAFCASDFAEAAQELESEMSAPLNDLADGMVYVLQALVMAESTIHSGSEEYSSVLLSRLGEKVSEDRLQALSDVNQRFANGLQKDPTGVSLIRKELVNMQMVMAGYNPYMNQAVEPHSFFNPTHVRGARFARDAYKEVYPHAQKIFGNGAGGK